MAGYSSSIHSPLNRSYLLLGELLFFFENVTFKHHIIILVCLVSISCLGPVKHLYPPAPDEYTKTIYVISHGWHTGIVIDSADLSDQKLTLPDFFKKSNSVEFGWGDEGFYTSKKFSLWITIKAVIYPTPTVLHLVDLRFSVATHFPRSGIVQVELSEKGFQYLCDFIANAFFIGENGHTVTIGPGIYGRSRFYRSNQSYFFPKTCNVWTASALRQAGCPITPLYAIRAENVFNQTKKFGIVIQDMKDH